MVFSPLLVLSSLAIASCSLYDRQELSVQVLEQKWPGNCEDFKNTMSREEYTAIAKELCRTNVELARLNDLYKAKQAELQSLKSTFEGQIRTLVNAEEQKLAREVAVKNKIRETCDQRCRLRRLASQGGVASQACQEELQRCENVLKSCDCGTGPATRDEDDEAPVTGMTATTSTTPAAPPSAPVSSSGPPNFIKLSTGYYYISTLQQKETWSDAQKRCKALGPNIDLVSIESKQENDALLQALGDAKEKFWLSGSTGYHGRGRIFSWRATGKVLEFKDWLPGEPNNRISKENCMQFFYNPNLFNGLKWNDDLCENKCRYICEYGQYPRLSFQ